MNRKEAEEWNQQTQEYLIEMSRKLEIEENLAYEIMDKYLEIVPETSKKDMVILGTESFSLKAGNVKLDIKCLMMAGAELFASISVPETFFNYIQLSLLTFMFAAKVAVKKLNKNCSVVVYTLDQLGAYDFYVNEEQVRKKADKICEEKGMDAIVDLTEVVNQLLNIRVIKMRNGQIALNEGVWGEI